MNRAIKHRKVPLEKTDAYFLAERVIQQIQAGSSCFALGKLLVSLSDGAKIHEELETIDIDSIRSKHPGLYTPDCDPITLNATHKLLAMCQEKIIRDALQKLAYRLRNKYGIGWRAKVEMPYSEYSI